MEPAEATARYSQEVRHFREGVKHVERRKLRADPATLESIGRAVDFLARALPVLVRLSERLPELRPAQRERELDKARREIQQRIAAAHSYANRYDRLLGLCPALANHWTAERHAHFLDALTDAREAVTTLGFALKAFDPTIPPIDPARPRVERAVQALGNAVPGEEWDGLPADFNERLDAYLYGRD